MDLLKEIQKNPFLLAPMAAITDCPFRSFMRKMGCGVVISELVSATGLKFNSEKTRVLMQYKEEQRPVGIQIFGYSLEDLSYASKEVEASGADFIDLNFGCPVPKVVKKGAGSAILKDLVKVRDVFRTVKSATNLPVTVKIRTGWDFQGRNAIDVAQIAYDEGLTWVAIHGRTRAQAYTGAADWDYIKDVKANSKIPIIGNGDITSPEIAVKRLNETGCDAVMIGRGCLKNPWIFKESMALLSETAKKEPKNFVEALELLQIHLEESCPERIVLLQLKKLSAWYSSGYPQSSEFRKNVFQSKEKDQVLDTIFTYFEKVNSLKQADTSGEAFLMGGHG